MSDGHRPLHGSVHDDGACWVCGSRDYGITVLGDELFDASDFVPPGVSRRAHWYDLCECRSCGHTWTATDHPSWLTTRAHEFIRYKEPTEHFPEIRALIEAHGIDVDAASIHTFSYKDQPLLDFLRPGTRPGPDIAGLTRDWEGDAATRRGRLAALRDELARSHAGHRIVLMRRILEHVASRTLLEEILGLVDDRTSLVFDMADFPALSRSTIDFVWNERRHYWTTSTVARIAASKGLALAASTAEATSEPTTIAVVTSDLVPELSLASSRNELKVGARLTALRRCAGEALPMGSSLAVIGASHKGISLLQLVVPSTLASAILDDNPERIGLSVPAVAVHPVRLIDHITEIGPAIAAMCVGDRARGQLTRRLRERGYVGRVVDFMCNDVSDS